MTDKELAEIEERLERATYDSFSPEWMWPGQAKQDIRTLLDEVKRLKDALVELSERPCFSLLLGEAGECSCPSCSALLAIKEAQDANT